MLILLVLALATYRVTRFAQLDTLIDRPRLRVHQFLLGRKSRWRAKAYELLTCPYCLSVWIAGGAVALADQFAVVALPWLAWPAVAAGAMMVWHYVEEE